MTQMSKHTFILSALGFAAIIVLANFSVQYPVFGTHLTYGALCYPLSFLLMNILSEKYSRAQVLKTLRLACASVYPEYFCCRISHSLRECVCVLLLASA